MELIFATHNKNKVKEVQTTVLPEADDAWAKDNSEFETVAELRSDLEMRLGRSRTIQAITARRNNIAEAVAKLIDDENVHRLGVRGRSERPLLPRPGQHQFLGND